MPNYVEVEEFSDWLEIGGPGDDAHLERAISTAEQDVDEYCGWGAGGFIASTSTSVNKVDKRWVSPDGRRLLLPFGIYDATGFVLKTDEGDDGTFETTWASTDYELAPVDGRFSGVDGFPFCEIWAVGDYLFPRTGVRRAVAEVTALTGWAAVPSSVRSATQQRAAQVFMRRQSSDGRTSFGFRAGGRDRDWELELANVRHPRKNVPFA